MTKWEKLFWGVLAVGLVISFTACQTAKTIIDTCRDGLCR